MRVPPTGPAPVRARLRAATDGLHQRLDACITSQAPFASLQRYGRFLAGHQEARRRLRARFGGLAPSEEWVPRLELHARLLAADLAALPFLTGEAVAAGEPVPAGTATDPSEGWGILYVLEGSMAGAAVLGRRLERTLGSGVPAAYLGLGGGRPPVMAQVARALEDCADPASAAAAARACFGVYLEVFTAPFPNLGLYP